MRHLVTLGRLLFGALLVAAVPSIAHAEGNRVWNVCGGTSFQTCASVSVTVVRNPNGTAVVTMEIRNLSGQNGTYAGTVFTNVGLDNVMPTSINVITNPRSGDYVFSVTGPCASGPQCDYTNQWNLANNQSTGGGVRVDLLSGTDNGSRYSIASSCNNGLAPGHMLFFLTGCAAGSGGMVTLQFAVTGDFDPNATGDVFVKGQSGPNGQSTTCITGGDHQNCYPTTVTPEPLTAVLLGTGLAALGGIGRIRRRREQGEVTTSNDA
jgi:MYXO-CTERM domain-containing protein